MKVRKHDADFLSELAEKMGISVEDAVSHVLARYRELDFRMKSALKLAVVEAQKGNMLPYWALVEQGWVRPEEAIDLMGRQDIDTDILLMTDRELDEMYRFLDEQIRRAEREKDAQRSKD